MLHRWLGHKAGYVLALAPAFIFLHFAGYLGETAAGSDLVPGIAAGGRFLFSVPWVPSIGVGANFYVDGLSLVFAMLISGIGFFIVLYAGGYLKGHEHQGRFFSYILLFMAAMLGVVLADDVVTLFVYWELTSVTSFLLIGFDHRRQAARRAAIQALVVTGGGGLLLLAGLLLLSTVTGTLSVSAMLQMGDGVAASALYVPILLLVLGGAFTKSAQVPFHFWLPNAMEAPTPVSAYLHSATMVKAGVYLLMRLNPVLGDTLLWETILPVFGGATLLTGAILALRQTDLKLMLAYTTVASLGLLVALTGTSEAEIIKGAALYLVAHSLFKGALFMVAGTIDHEAGTRDLTKLGGLRAAMPITFAAALGAALSMGGLPPFLGFLAKEVMYHGTTHHPDVWMVLLTGVLILGNALMFAAGFTVALRPFLGPKVETPRHAHEGPFMLYAGPVTLASAGLLAGLLAHLTGVNIIGPLASAIVYRPVEVELHLWGGFNLALALSAVTLTLGALFYWKLACVRAVVASFLDLVGWGPDKGFDQFVGGLVGLSTRVTRVVQSGDLERYITLSFVFVAIVLVGGMSAFGEWTGILEAPDLTFWEWAVILMALVGIWAVLVATSRLTAIVSLGIQGFAVALIFMLFGAPDLSFTQFMVETLSVVILALVLTRLSLVKSDHRPFWEAMKDGAIAVAGGVGFAGLLLTATSRPFNARLSDFFSEYSLQVAHGRNIVNVIIVDFRGFDTMGEIAVVMVAGLSILALVRHRARGVTGTEPPREADAPTEGEA
ncbi:MAG: putative monovalent cation/H+ antiporter subunit A [Hyphomicrobiaceae bacterium]|nr:putative monovalent cation/H+ antiporter subunit A [Hyphomicrobiaceae bacterium]